MTKIEKKYQQTLKTQKNNGMFFFFCFNFYGCDLYFFRIKKSEFSLPICMYMYVCMYDPNIISQFGIMYF
jgi:hypothetical protein